MKKLVVISDIQSNHSALKAALNIVDELTPDGIIFLGDYITDLPYPQKTMSLIYEYKNKYPCWFVRGNREDYIIHHNENADDGWCYSSSTGALLYTYENLTKKDLDFFSSMPTSCEIKINDCSIITACHASPASTSEWIKGNDDLLNKYTKTLESELLLCGHTHKTEVCHFNDKTVIFCPSLGQPQEGINSRGLTVLKYENNNWQYEFIPVMFSIDDVLSEYIESGLIKKSKIWSLAMIMSLYTKQDIAFDCVTLAWKKARKDNCHCTSTLPEKYWTEAASECGLFDFAEQRLKPKFYNGLPKEWHR